MEQFMITLAECTLIMTVAALGLFALTPLLKNVNPKGIYIAWIVILIGFLVPYRPHFISPLFEITIGRPAGPAAASAPGFTAAAGGDAASGDVSVAAPSSGFSLSGWQILFIVWLAGVAAALVYHFIKYRQFTQVVQRWGKPVADAAVLECFERVKNELGTGKGVLLLFCEPVDSPMLLGITQPKILLPSLDLTADELTVVFRHELTHFKRKDLLIKMLMLIANVVHWFNPAVYFVSKALFFYSEASCDFEATKNEDMDERQYYSETIISVIRRQSKMKTALSTSFYGGKNGMKRRILSIMNTAKRRAGLIAVAVAIALVSATSIVFAVNTPAAGAVDTTGKNDAYKALAQMAELDYESMTVAEFAAEVERISQEAGSNIFSVISEADIDYENGDPLYPFVAGVLEHTGQELFAAEVGGEETPFISGRAEKLREHDIMSDKGTMSDEEFEAFLQDVQKYEDAGFDTTAYDFQAYFTYTLLYDIPDPDALTVGEREGRIAGIGDEFQAYIDGQSEEDLAGENAKSAMTEEITRLAQKYSDNKISFEYDDLRFEMFDGENEMFA